MKSNIYPVIHHLDEPMTLLNTKIAVEAGCAGIFLISMDGQDKLLSPMTSIIKSRYHDLFIGINRLGSSPVDALVENLQTEVNATWVDSCGIVNGHGSEVANELAVALGMIPDHKLFCGVAFKYQAIDHKAAESALLVG